MICKYSIIARFFQMRKLTVNNVIYCHSSSSSNSIENIPLQKPYSDNNEINKKVIVQFGVVVWTLFCKLTIDPLLLKYVKHLWVIYIFFSINLKKDYQMSM